MKRNPHGASCIRHIPPASQKLIPIWQLNCPRIYQSLTLNSCTHFHSLTDVPGRMVKLSPVSNAGAPAPSALEQHGEPAWGKSERNEAGPLTQAPPSSIKDNGSTKHVQPIFRPSSQRFVGHKYEAPSLLRQWLCGFQWVCRWIRRRTFRTTTIFHTCLHGFSPGLSSSAALRCWP